MSLKIGKFAISGILSLSLFSQTLLAEKIESQDKKVTLSDGSYIENQDLGISIAAPAGWEVIEGRHNLSFIIQEPTPKNDKPDYKNPKYQRHITVAAMHSSSPIDDKRASELENQLLNKVKDNPMISDFSVFDRKFFDYKAKNDGLVLYTTLKINQFDMMQMHVLVSGESKQFLLSYTDLASRFQSDEATLANVWQTISSVEVLGSAPIRYMKELQMAGGIGSGLFVLIAIGLFRRRKNRLVLERLNAELESGVDFGDFEADEWNLIAPRSMVENEF